MGYVGTAAHSSESEFSETGSRPLDPNTPPPTLPTKTPNPKATLDFMSGGEVRSIPNWVIPTAGG